MGTSIPRSLTQELYLAWLRTAWLARRVLGIKAYGIGWMASRVGSAFDFEFQGASFRFSPSAARSYCLIPAGIPNEPETHQFLERILEDSSNVLFVDVGASIGEFAVPMAHNRHVAKVVAFEPHPVTCDALSLSASRVPAGKIEIVKKGVSTQAGSARFDLSQAAPTAAGLRQSTDQGGHDIELCTLDGALQAKTGTAVILLIDIEGGELGALSGGMNFIGAHHPVIIFEYNETTRRHFRIEQAIDLLGEAYEVFRLRSQDGRLDRDLSATWNVVALPKTGPWRRLWDASDLFAARSANQHESEVA